MRPVFEEFTDARTVLSDVKLRQSYLRGMLDVFKYYGGDLHLAESHNAWNRKHRPDRADEGLSATKKKGGAGDGKKSLRLEGGLHQQVPRGVVLQHRRDGKKDHVVSVGIHVLKPIHEFYARVRSIRVEMTDTTDDFHVIELSRKEIVENIKVDKQVRS